MNKESVFVINVYHDFKDAMYCIQCIKKFYPDTKIVTILDGTAGRDYIDYCKDNNVRVVRGVRLYNNDGGKWIRRWMEEGLKDVGDSGFIVKIDPETEIRKPLSYTPKCDVFGCFHSPQKGFHSWIVQGGFHAISKESAEYLLSHQFVDNPIYLSDTYKEYRVTHRHGSDTQFLFNDAQIFSDIVKTAKLSVVDHNEIFCCTKFGETFDATPYHIIHLNTWRNIAQEPKPCKVFGVGLPKCATLSTVTALKHLGYKGIHYPHNYLGCLPYFEAIFDLPIAANFELLDELYPGSKFIFNIRKDVDEWCTSLEWWFKEIISKNDKIDKIPHMKRLLTESRKGIFGCEYYKNKKDMIEGRQNHINRVKNYFKGREQDLLWFDVTEGDSWEELCNFVGEDIPNTPFPHNHNHKEERKDFKSTW